MDYVYYFNYYFFDVYLELDNSWRRKFNSGLKLLLILNG